MCDGGVLVPFWCNFGAIFGVFEHIRFYIPNMHLVRRQIWWRFFSGGSPHLRGLFLASDWLLTYLAIIPILYDLWDPYIRVKIPFQHVFSKMINYEKKIF